jgi:hypothetical protein
VEGTAYLNPMISDYFSGVFSTQSICLYDTDPAVLERVVPNVTLEMNTALQMLYAAEGIKKAPYFL